MPSLIRDIQSGQCSRGSVNDINDNERPPMSQRGNLGPSLDSSFGSLQGVESKAPGVAVEGTGVKKEAAKETVDDQVQRAINIVRARYEGRTLDCEKDWVELDFTPSQYQRLRDELELEGLAVYFETTIRHDYDPCRSILVFRMPSAVHDLFGRRLLIQVHAWIARIQAENRSPQLNAILSQIESAGTSDIISQVPGPLVPAASATSSRSRSRSHTAVHSPDGQFAYGDYKYPPLVLEVGYSSKGKGGHAKNLPGLAKYYYEELGIKTVLTVNLAYASKTQRRAERTQQRTRIRTRPERRNSKRAAYSLYRGEERIVSDRAFRDKSGDMVPSEGLTLYVSDLVPDAVLRDDSHDLGRPEFSLQISAQELFDILTDSERLQEVRERTASLPPVEPPREPPCKRKIAWALPDSSDDGGRSPEDDEDEDTGASKT